MSKIEFVSLYHKRKVSAIGFYTNQAILKQTLSSLLSSLIHFSSIWAAILGISIETKFACQMSSG